MSRYFAVPVIPPQATAFFLGTELYFGVESAQSGTAIQLPASSTSLRTLARCVRLQVIKLRPTAALDLSTPHVFDWIDSDLPFDERN